MNSLQVRIRALEATNLPLNDKGTCYPVIQAKFKGLEKTFSSAVQTTVAQNTVNPHWNQEISLFANKIDDVLIIKVFDRTPGTSEKTLGRIEIPLARYLNQPMKDEWFQLVTKRSHYREWIGSKADYYAVPGLLHLQIWFGFTQGQQMPSQPVSSFVPAPVILGSAYQPISSQQIPSTPTQVYIPRPT